MTASIVGCAHTPFGKMDALTIEDMVVQVRTKRWSMPESPLPTSTKS